MPKQAVKEVQIMRKAQKEKLRKFPVATVYLQVVGSGAPGAPRSLYVFTEHCRYLFNCGEGTQRLSYEHKIKLTMAEHVLFTSKTWENVGGLPGALLTLQDTGVPKISLHGPPGIDTLCYDTKEFMRLDNIRIEYCHYELGIFEEGPLNVIYVPIWPSEKQSKDSLLNCEVEENESDVSSQSVNKDRSNNESIICKDLSMAYVCRPSPKPGTLLPDKCKTLGVPKGPLLGDLKRGVDVTLPCGKIIKASEVTTPADPGPVFIVIEIPTLSHLDSLLSSSQIQMYQKATAQNVFDVAQVIVHFTPVKVAHHPKYRLWCDTFDSHTTHIYINEDSRCLGSERVHKIQHKLNHIYPLSFPLLFDSPVIKNWNNKKRKFDDTNGSFHRNDVESSIKSVDVDENSRVNSVNSLIKSVDANSTVDYNVDIDIPQHLQAHTLLTYHLRPHSGLELKDNPLKFDPAVYVSECYDDPSFAMAYKKVQENLNLIQMTNNQIPDKEFPVITFLGTGSCIPNKTRNTSGIALQISDCCSMIMDCGEGTYGQLVRLKGLVETNAFLVQLKVIYVSHLHADHHIGLIRLLLARKRHFDQLNIPASKLYLIAPQRIEMYLKSYDSNFESISDTFILIGNHNFNSVNRTLAQKMTFSDVSLKEILNYCEIKSLSTCLVNHCRDAYGVALTFRDDWKVVYSGDTRPCPSLEVIGKNCDVLIHEATMEDELLEDAKSKRHSTTSEALDSAVAMSAKFVLLTHFSQRYAKVPLIETVPPNVAVAFDNMKVCVKDLPCLASLYPAFVAAFSQDVDDMVEKTRKRKARDLEKISSEIFN